MSSIADAENRRGMELVTAGHISAALAAFDRAIAISAEAPDYHANRGLALLLRNEVGDIDAAIDEFVAALALDDQLAVVHSYVGGAYSLRQEDTLAIHHLARSVALEPSLFAYRQLSLIYARNGLFREALTQCDALLALHPADEPARANRAMMLLALGQFAEGWHDFEYRNHMPEERERTDRLRAAYPHLLEWQGEDISGKHLLVHAEGGMGDSLQFLRFVPDLADRCARLSIYDRAEARRLLNRSFGSEKIIVCDIPPADADYFTLTMSAGRRLGLDASNVSRPPYLRPPASTEWDERLAGLPYPRVGIVWAGSASNIVDTRRSLTLDQVRPLFEVPVGWVSLQMERGSSECPIYDASPHISDWLDTAALVAQLDLVIGVDTSVPHLAGGLGKPVWLLNRFDTCWRWGVEGDTTPWYPTMRIFRQPTLGDWQPVIDQVMQELWRLSNVCDQYNAQIY